MAHQTNVNQVKLDLQPGENKAEITDPSCGRKMTKKEAKHVLFRETESIYFCSRECLDRYRTAKRPTLAA